MLAPEPRWMTLAEFDPIDEASDERLELLDGEMLAFAGGTNAHSQLAGHLFAAIYSAVEPPCVVHASDFAIRSEAAGAYLYPDVAVVCGEMDLEARWTSAPVLVVEVLSRSTASRDRGPKLDVYKHLPAMREVLLVDSRRRWVQQHVRTPDGAWRDRTVDGGRLELAAVTLAIDVDAIYDRVGPARLPA